MISVVLVDEVDNDFDHGVFFFGAAFGDHQSEGYKCIVGDTLGTVLIIKYAIAVEKPQEQCGCDAFVAVAEGVILGDKVQEHGCLLLD